MEHFKLWHACVSQPLAFTRSFTVYGIGLLTWPCLPWFTDATAHVEDIYFCSSFGLCTVAQWLAYASKLILQLDKSGGHTGHLQYV